MGQSLGRSPILDDLGETSQIGELLQGFWDRCVVVKRSCKQDAKNLELRKPHWGFHTQNGRGGISDTLYWQVHGHHEEMWSRTFRRLSGPVLDRCD
jgi:hypothetical protein